MNYSVDDHGMVGARWYTHQILQLQVLSENICQVINIKCLSQYFQHKHMLFSLLLCVLVKIKTLYIRFYCGRNLTSNVTLDATEIRIEIIMGYLGIKQTTELS